MMHVTNETCLCCWVWQCGWHTCISDLLTTPADTWVEQYKWQYWPHYSAELRWHTSDWISPGPEGHHRTPVAGLHQCKLLLSNTSKAAYQDQNTTIVNSVMASSCCMTMSKPKWPTEFLTTWTPRNGRCGNNVHTVYTYRHIIFVFGPLKEALISRTFASNENM